MRMASVQNLATVRTYCSTQAPRLVHLLARRRKRPAVSSPILCLHLTRGPRLGGREHPGLSLTLLPCTTAAKERY